MRFLSATAVIVLLAASATAAAPLAWVKKPELTRDPKTGTWSVAFELDALCDVEVAIIDPRSGAVVRHLGAGVLGPKAPPPFAANARSQKLEWDGKDDYRVAVPKPEALAVRVRAGMSVALERIVGGDPYAYYSDWCFGDSPNGSEPVGEGIE